MSDTKKKLDDYPPWIQNAAKEIWEKATAGMSTNRTAEIISRHHEVEPKFAPPRPEDTARVLEHFARNILAEIQFKGHNAVCPVCRKNPHKPDCRLAALLPELKDS